MPQGAGRGPSQAETSRRICATAPARMARPRLCERMSSFSEVGVSGGRGAPRLPFTLQRSEERRVCARARVQRKRQRECGRCEPAGTWEPGDRRLGRGRGTGPPGTVLTSFLPEWKGIKGKSCKKRERGLVSRCTLRLCDPGPPAPVRHPPWGPLGPGTASPECLELLESPSLSYWLCP